MTERPKSLLQMANAPAHPSPLDKAALVIIDAQEEYLSGKLPLKNVGPAIAEIEALLAVARQHGTPVFHIVHHSKPGAALFDPNGPGSAIVAPLTPRDGETVVPKAMPNSFAGTDLHERIQKTERKELIIAGFMTHQCVSSTARAALDLGYRTTIVASATATRDLPDPTGTGTIPAEIVQQGTLTGLSDRIAIIAPNAKTYG